MISQKVHQSEWRENPKNFGTSTGLSAAFAAIHEPPRGKSFAQNALYP